MVAIREHQLRLIAIEDLRSTQVTVGVRMRSDFVRHRVQCNLIRSDFDHGCGSALTLARSQDADLSAWLVPR